MDLISRRSLILSGAALATGAFVAPPRPRRARFRSGSPAPASSSDSPAAAASCASWGATIRCGIGGINAGAIIGASAADLVGTARDLRQPGDIAGIYSAIGAGLAIAGGRQGATLQNANGVVLSLHGRQMGLMFSINLSGMSISLS